MRFRFARLVVTAVAPAAVLVPVVAASAQPAAATSWAVVFTHHYGKPGNYSGYSAVAAVGPADVWVFGSTNVAGLPAPGTPVAAHWNGTSWASSVLPAGLTSEIAAASADSASDVWAVTETGGDILHWNGAQWSVAEHVNGAPGGLFTGITALSSTDVWAFGGSGAGPGLGTWHFDGHTWTNVTGNAVSIFTASAISATDIWAVANNPQGQPAIMHYDGTTWQQVTTAPPLGYSAILALSSTNVWATGTDQNSTPWLVHYTGGQWTKLALPWAGLGLGSLAPDGRGGLRLSAPDPGTSRTWMLHYSASGVWSRTALTASIGQVTLIPGTTTGLAAGLVRTATGANATLWAHGKIG